MAEGLFDNSLKLLKYLHMILLTYDKYKLKIE